ncbi:MAG TPA: hypothetical protein VH207_09895 [Chthoniobacterales bacterium]|nr:hypothetical protein [Chthoniobacterales bacterium]
MKSRFRNLAPLALALLVLVSLGSCGRGSSTDASLATPVSELDVMINRHEKVANEYVRVAKKVKSGDLSLTIRYIDLEKATRAGSARLQQEAPRMTPQQAQRVASISAKAAPYLQP